MGWPMGKEGGTLTNQIIDISSKTPSTMEKSIKLLRRSTNAFQQNFHSSASTSAALVFPFAAALLYSQATTPSSSRTLRTLSSRIYALFNAAGLPASSQFFSLLNLKLSQTIFSFLSTLPFALTFLVISKAAIVRTILRPPNPTSLLRLYRWLAPTYVFNTFVILSANAAVFSILFLAFNSLDILHLTSENSILGLSAAAAVLYSIVLANTTVVCNLAMIVSAMENCSGYLALLKACILIRGSEATGITIALPATLGMAALESLFQYRIVKPYLRFQRLGPAVVGEASFIALAYSVVIVLDTIVSCILYRSCNKNSELEPEEKGDSQA